MSDTGIVARFEDAATRRSAVGSFVVFVVTMVVIQTVGYRPEVTAMASGTLPEVAFFYSAADVSAVLESLGSEGRSLYTRALLVDFVFVLTFVAGLGLPLAYLLPQVTESAPVRALALAPAVAGACDYVENVVLLYAISTFPEMPGAAITVASVFTAVKLPLLIGSMLLLLLSAAAVGVRVARSRT